MELSYDERQRYARHYHLPGFSDVHQERLKNAKVLVVGAGGLGSPVLSYLSAAGVGHIGVIDPDVVELSNLQRQILFQSDDIHKSKVEVARDRLLALNHHVHIEIYPYALSANHAQALISQYDCIVDGSDNFPTRYLVNDACVLCDRPLIHASIHQYEGQLSVFHGLLPDGKRGPNYRHIYPKPPRDGLVPDCAIGGVLGVLAGIIGSMQALEVIKVITGIGTPLIGQLLIYDALTCRSRIFKLQMDADIKIDRLINYDDFCGVGHTKSNTIMKEISVQELKQWREEGKDFQLIDVREAHEVDLVKISDTHHIPLGDIMDRADEIADDKEVVLMCRTGQRSAAALMALESQGKSNLYNLKGGIHAWATEIDTSLSTY